MGCIVRCKILSEYAKKNAFFTREDEEKFKNEAEAYANDIIPRARGKASRVLQESEA